jgi:hypothetical protein
VRVMSQTRKHLNSDRTGTHGGFPPFVMQFHRCKRDSVDVSPVLITQLQMLLPSRVNKEIQSFRGETIPCIYPNASKIPLPWSAERSWSPNWVLAQCRISCAHSTASNNSLGEDQGCSGCCHQTRNTTLDQTVVLQRVFKRLSKAWLVIIMHGHNIPKHS